MNALRHWFQRFDTMSLRERVLVLAAALAVLFMGFYQLLLAPLQSGLQVKKQQWQTGQIHATAMESEIQALLRNAPLQAQSRLDAQRQMVATLDKELHHVGQRYPRQDELDRWLRALLTERPGVHCVRFHTLAPFQVYPRPQDKSASPGPRLYQSGASLTLQGDFDSLLAYLQSVQQGPWRLQWGAWTYTVIQYPKAELQIDVRTYAIAWSGREVPGQGTTLTADQLQNVLRDRPTASAGGS
ncbi:MAG: hypothetical protein ACYCYL_11770 [Acidithiobacillus sp.]